MVIAVNWNGSLRFDFFLRTDRFRRTGTLRREPFEGMAPFGPLYFHQRAPGGGYRCYSEPTGYLGECYWHRPDSS